MTCVVSPARAAAAEREEWLRALLESAPDAIVITKQDGVIELINQQTEKLFGYPRAEVSGKPAEALLPERYRDGQARYWQGLFADPVTRPMGSGLPLYGRRKDGTEFPVEISSAQLHTADGLLAFIAIRDITERRRQEEALRRSQIALAQAQKMEAVGQLTGGVAHDFNNLLTAIQGSLELLERQSGPIDPARLARLIRPATSAAQRGASLTHRLLAFSRQQPLASESVDVNRQVSSVSELLRRTLGESIAIETVLAGGLWRCRVDPNQLESALLNLAVNARDAMPDGGKLTIETGNTYLDEDYAAAHEEVASGQYVMIAISDSGIGMAPDIMARALEPFFTTKEPGKGTGLGLSQVYGLVKQSDGHIKLYSELGQGTTVKIYLPRYMGASTPERIPERSAPLPSADGKLVLLVEDDSDVREFGLTALRQLGYRVVEAADSESALDLLAEHPDIFVLFTDVGLPGLNGRQLADEARRRAPNLKVLYTTGYARNAIVHRGVLDAGVDLLPKPFTTDELGRKLQEILQRPRSPLRVQE